MIHFQHDIGHFVGALSRVPEEKREEAAVEFFRRLKAAQTFYDLAFAESKLKGKPLVSSLHPEYGAPTAYGILRSMGLDPRNVTIEGWLYSIVELFCREARK